MFTTGTNEKVWWKCQKGHSYYSAIVNRVHDRNCPYCAHKLPIIGETDFATVHPELLAEWDKVKNKGKHPQDYVYGSTKKVWWKCEMNHSWKASIYNRHKGFGRCRLCNGNEAIPYKTDAATITPHLIDEWDYEKNDDLDIRTLLPFDNRKFWWRCNDCGKNWQSTIGARTQGSMCPDCFGKANYRPRLVR